MKHVNATLLRMLALAGTMLLAGCTVFGIRSGTEQPTYEVVERLDENIEVRRYAPRLAAEVEVAIEPGDDGRSRAFRILADYIFGANRPESEIAMTAPVSVETAGREIAMTAPVEVDAAGTPDSGSMTMRFFLPAELTFDTAPRPNDPRVRLVQLPAETMAAVRFTGARDAAAIARREADLLAALGDNRWAPAGEPVAYLYDPPWTIPFLRRNEVVVAAARR